MDDDAMKEITESVKAYGVLTPAIIRPHEAGGYEIIAGCRHGRRHHYPDSRQNIHEEEYPAQ